MAILNEDKTGSGDLYSMPSNDSNALLAAGTTYYQTGTGNRRAISDQLAYSSIVVAGTVFSQGIGIGAELFETGHFHLTLTGSGYLYGLSTALDMSSTSNDSQLEVTNAGTIASDAGSGTIKVTTGYLDLTNTGTISGSVAILSNIYSDVSSGTRGDIVLNSGVIDGDIYLGQLYT